MTTKVRGLLSLQKQMLNGTSHAVMVMDLDISADNSTSAFLHWAQTGLVQTSRTPSAQSHRLTGNAHHGPAHEHRQGAADGPQACRCRWA